MDKGKCSNAMRLCIFSGFLFVDGWVFFCFVFSVLFFIYGEIIVKHQVEYKYYRSRSLILMFGTD